VITHDPLLCGVAQGIFSLSTERLARSTSHLKVWGEGSLYSWYLYLSLSDRHLFTDEAGRGGGEAVPDPPEAPLGGGGFGLGNVGLGGHQGCHLLFLRTISLSNNVM
jgi:hypothetical protein